MWTHFWVSPFCGKPNTHVPIAHQQRCIYIFPSYSRTLQYAAGRWTATAGASFTLLSLIMRIGLGQVFARHQMHDRGAAEGQPKGAESHGAVQKPPLVDQPQDLRPGHTFRRPIGFGPVVVDMYGDITGRVYRTEHELLCFAGNQD